MYSVCVQYKHATVDSILMVVDQKDRAPERVCSPYIPKPIAHLTYDMLVDNPLLNQ